MTKIPIHYDIFDGITYVERQYSTAKRERIEDNRVMKVQDKMRLIPAVPEKARHWIWEMEGAEQYIFKDKEKRFFCCQNRLFRNPFFHARLRQTWEIGCKISLPRIWA